MLSESKSGYIWHFNLFYGQSNIVVGFTKNVLGSLLGKCHTLYTDKYYTLATELETE